MAEPCEPVVSIQRLTAADTITGHLAWGVLMDSDLVLTPGPLDWLRDPTVQFEVLLASARRNGPGVVERIKAEQAEVFGLQANPDGAVAVLRLAQPSQHKPFRGAAYDAREFGERLAGAPSVWEALETVGDVPGGLLDLPVDRVLGPVNEWELIRRRDLVRINLSPTPDEVGIKWCCIFRRCPCDLCQGRWW
jgi:hypothetical protein